MDANRWAIDVLAGWGGAFGWFDIDRVFIADPLPGAHRSLQEKSLIGSGCRLELLVPLELVANLRQKPAIQPAETTYPESS